MKFTQSIAILMVIAILGSFTQASNSDKCYGLAIGNGNSMGAYQAGVISTLLTNSAKDDVAYQAISGVTEGALNAMIVSQFESGQEQEASDALQDFWKEKIAGQKVYGQYTLGAVEGSIFHDSLFKGEPLYDIIDQEFSDAQLKRQMNIGIANMNNGSFVNFNEKFRSENLVKALQASVSYPGILEPVEAWNDLWFSGDSIWEIDVMAPIIRCLDNGYEQKDIVIDAIIGNNKVIEEVDVSEFNAFSMAKRTYELMHYYSQREGLLKAEMAYPDVTFRHTIGRSSEWYDNLNLVPISQSKNEVNTKWQLGQIDAMESINELKANGKVDNSKIFRR